MKSFNRPAATLATALLATLSFAAEAGVYVETVTRNKSTGKEETAQRMQVQDGKGRFEASPRAGMPQGRQAMVTLFKDGALYMLDTERKVYTVMDKAAVERTAGAMKDAMENMRTQMANLPPEQRARMEAMMQQRGGMGMGQTKPVVIDAVATGASESVEGRSCKVWNITHDGKPATQLCVVPYSGLPGKDEFQALAKQMSALFEKLSANMGQQFNDNPFRQDNAIAGKINGVPFITRHFRDGVLDPEETVVKTWKSQSFAASQFDIPADYTKQEMPDMRGMQPKKK